MKTITREEWIEALESGKYAQTQGTLLDRDGYCCLGVACELAGMEKKSEHQFVLHAASLVGSPYVPTDIRDMLQLDAEMQRYCVKMNDTLRLTFPQIAAELRKEFNMEPKDADK